MKRTVDASSPVLGKTLHGIKLPLECMPVAVLCRDELLLPRGGTALLAGDKALLAGDTALLAGGKAAIAHNLRPETLADILGPWI